MCVETGAYERRKAARRSVKLAVHKLLVEIVHMVDIDVPAGAGAPSLDTQPNRRYTGWFCIAEDFRGKKLQKLLDIRGGNICGLLTGATKECHAPNFHGENFC